MKAHRKQIAGWLAAVAIPVTIGVFHADIREWFAWVTKTSEEQQAELMQSATRERDLIRMTCRTLRRELEIETGSRVRWNDKRLYASVEPRARTLFSLLLRLEALRCSCKPRASLPVSAWKEREPLTEELIEGIIKRVEALHPNPCLYRSFLEELRPAVVRIM